MFSHKFCFIRAGSAIRKPSDLRGARIGLRSYENTLALVTKGMFHNSYGLPVHDVTWVIINQEAVGCPLPSTIKLERVEGKWRLEDLLIQGKVNAEVEPDLPGMDSGRRDRGAIIPGIREGGTGLLYRKQDFSDHASDYHQDRYFEK